MTDDQFKTEMCMHMKAQTDFLRDISEGMKAVRMFGRIIKWVGGAVSTGAGITALWSFLSKH